MEFVYTEQFDRYFKLRTFMQDVNPNDIIAITEGRSSEYTVVLRSLSHIEYNPTSERRKYNES